MSSPYWGPKFPEREIEEVLNKDGVMFEKLNGNEIFIRIAKDIAEGKIVGWFQGRSEWGPSDDRSSATS
ncbi:hypothetical protein MYX76_19285, partial [Desulfobacterota bacterium AH_259_B03_O07]|nr:hypothetical protein [Desulfobacterota bacterium AH_259_B03_O07]